jgi:catecholate siderophore receptor
MRHGTAFSFQPVSDLFTLRNNSDQLKPSETVNKESGEIRLECASQYHRIGIRYVANQYSGGRSANANFSLPQAARAHAAWNSASPVI